MNAPTLPAVYDRFMDVVSSGDIEQFLDLFAGAGLVKDWGEIHYGRDAIRAWSNAEFLGAGVTLDVSRVVDVEGTVTITAAVGGNGFNGPSTFVLVPSGEQLRELVIAA